MSEIFSDAFPLTGGKKTKKIKTGRVLRTVFTALRIILFAGAVFFCITAALSAAGVIQNANNALLYTIETFKYLSVELLMAMFFWVVFTGRGYCYYCPAGTLIALISRIAGQQIRTDLNRCISCGKCNDACQMSIDIRSRASEGKPVVSMDCVGCGHCVDVCPANTLEYSTRFLSLTKKK